MGDEYVVRHRDGRLLVKKAHAGSDGESWPWTSIEAHAQVFNSMQEAATIAAALRDEDRSCQAEPFERRWCDPKVGGTG